MYSPMEPTFTGFTVTVNQIVLAIANAQQALWAGLAFAACGTTVGLVSGNPGNDLTNDLAAAEHGDIGDLVKGIAVYAFALIHAEDAQQRHRDGRDRPGRAVLHLHRSRTPVGQGECLHALGPGLEHQAGNRLVERAF